MEKEAQEKLHEMQTLEQQLQQFLMQKQTFQNDLSETESAIEALKASGDDVFKLIGQLLVKVDKKETQDEMQNRQKLIEARLNSLEKQEEKILKRLESLRDEVVKSMNRDKK